MNSLIAIFLKDLRIALSSPLAYVLTASYLFMSGFFFFNFLRTFNPVQKMSAMTGEGTLSFNSGVIIPLYQAQLVLLLFIIPLVTMRSVSEERARGSFELILSTGMPITSFVIGKWCALFVLLSGVVGLGFIYPLTIILFGDPEVPAVIMGLIGLFLYTGVLIALGVFISSLTTSQAVAGILTLIFSLAWFLVDAPFAADGSDIGIAVRSISISSSVDEFFRGVVSISNLFFFVTSCMFLLFLAVQVLSTPRSAR